MPYEDGRGAAKKDVEAVQELSATSPGSGDVSWSQDSPGVVGVAEAGDHFGSAVARVYGSEDLWLVGVPDDHANTSGMVDVLDRQDDQDRAWVPGPGRRPVGGPAVRGGPGERRRQPLTPPRRTSAVWPRVGG